MTTHPLDPVLEEHARVLQHDPGYTVLRRVPEPYSRFPDDGVPPDGRCVAIVDRASTGKMIPSSSSRSCSYGWTMEARSFRTMGR